MLLQRIPEIQERWKAPLQKLEKWEGLENVGGEKKVNTSMLQTGGVLECTQRAPPHMVRKKISRNLDSGDHKCLMNVWEVN